jgi:hypothetical protein
MKMPNVNVVVLHPFVNGYTCLFFQQLLLNIICFYTRLSYIHSKEIARLIKGIWLFIYNERKTKIHTK